MNKKYKYKNPKGYGTEQDFNSIIKDGKIKRLEREQTILEMFYTAILEKLIKEPDALEELATEIEDTERDKVMNRNTRIRYVGLILVQGSSALALLSFDLIIYWCALWSGLLCYQITAMSYYKEDNTVYRETLEKFTEGRGSSLATVNSLDKKRKREMVYIIGNTIGLILIGLNIITS